MRDQQAFAPATVIERGALEAWYALDDFERKPRRDPDEPLREKGGVYDPGAWCMRAAKAVACGDQPPRIYKNVSCPDWIADRITSAEAGWQEEER